MTNVALAYKKQLRKEAVIKWKKKKLKMTCNTNVTINKSNEQIIDTIHTSICNLNENITEESQRLNKRILRDLGPSNEKSTNLGKKLQQKWKASLTISNFFY